MTVIDSHLEPQSEDPNKKTWRDYRTPLHETPRAYSVYLQYRDMGPLRSLTGLQNYYRKRAANAPPDAPDEERYIPSITTIKKWSSTFYWYQRVQDYDEEMQLRKQLRREERREAMDEEHYEVARGQLYRIINFIDGRIKAGEFGDTASVAYAKLMAYLQRVAAGAPTEKSEQTTKIEGKAELEHTHLINPRNFNDEELEQLRELAIALKQRELGQ